MADFSVHEIVDRLRIKDVSLTEIELPCGMPARCYNAVLSAMRNNPNLVKKLTLHLAVPSKSTCVSLVEMMENTWTLTHLVVYYKDEDTFSMHHAAAKGLMTNRSIITLLVLNVVDIAPPDIIFEEFAKALLYVKRDPRSSWALIRTRDDNDYRVLCHRAKELAEPQEGYKLSADSRCLIERLSTADSTLTEMCISTSYGPMRDRIEVLNALGNTINYITKLCVICSFEEPVPTTLIQAIGWVLRTTETLEVLVVSGKGFDETLHYTIACALHRNKTLREIEITGITCGHPYLIKREYADAIAANPTYPPDSTWVLFELGKNEFPELLAASKAHVERERTWCINYL